MAKYKPDDLIDSIMVISEISCTKCAKKETEMADAYDVYEYLFKSGWRQTPSHTYCPRCAKKHLKLK